MIKPQIWDIYNADVFFEDKIEKKTRPVLVIDEINYICLSLKITYNTKRVDNPDDITDKYVDKIFLKINLRPRKCLNYKTPYGIYHKVLLHLT